MTMRKVVTAGLPPPRSLALARGLPSPRAPMTLVAMIWEGYASNLSQLACGIRDAFGSVKQTSLNLMA